MADLGDLHAALQSLAISGKTAKVSFYYVGDEDQKLHSGSIAVEAGEHCYLNFQQLAPEAAMAAITRLTFAKVSSLPAMSLSHETPAISMERVLDRLDPRKLPKPVAPEPVAAPVVVAPPEPAKPAHVFYSHLSLQKDTLDLLEPLFGVGAARKLEEFARAAPPHQFPLEFLDKCRQHAAMMLGPKKAEELFRPIAEKLQQ